MSRIMVPDPDWSDSDDSLFDEYFEERHSIRNSLPVQELTPEQKKQQELNQLFNAISSGNVDSVLKFINESFDINGAIRDGWTPILLASSHGNPELTKVLIEHGCDVNLDRDGMTALMMACNCPDYISTFEKSLQVIKLLVEKGANVEAINRKRMNALMHAATTGNLLAVKYLLPLTDENAVDNQGWSALTWAISNNQVEVVKYLFEERFNLNLVDIRGHTPFDIAKDNGLSEIVNLFPKSENDVVYDIIACNKISFKDHFVALKKGEVPKFFSEICNFLVAVKCEHLIPLFHDQNVTLKQFLTMSDSNLREIGVLLPYQRYRIITGLHRFHKQPYHPKSLHVCVKNKCYTNVDIATQLTSALQQAIVMESSLKFILKTLTRDNLTKEERTMLIRTIASIKLKIRSCKLVNEKLGKKIIQWDKNVEPPDLITKNSIKTKLPWTKITLCIGVLSLVLIYKFNQ